MRKSISIAYIVMFLIMFIAPTLLYSLLGKYIDNTNYEQRSATEKPVLSIDTIEEYPSQYEDYYNDALPFRTQMIEINGLIKYKMFNQSPVKKVIIGKDGWLFYNPDGTDGDPIGDLNGINCSDDMLAWCVQNLLTVKNSLEEQGKEFVVMIAPNKESIYGTEFLPSKYVNPIKETSGDTITEYLKRHSNLRLVYPKNSILEQISTNPDDLLYYKTDTHWNALGAYYGANELLKELNVGLPSLEGLDIDKKNDHAGDLADMMGMTKHFNYDIFYSVDVCDDGQQIVAEYPVEGENRIVHYTTDNADPRTILVVKDSFSNGMISYISASFNNCYFIDQYVYKPEYIEQFNADIVVLETVERYANNLMMFSVER